MKTFLRLFIPFFFFLFFSHRLFAQQNDLEKSLDTLVNYLMGQLHSQAAIGIAIVKDGNVIYDRAWGYRHVTKKLKANSHTPFYIASTTKSFVCTLAKMLEDEGKLSLDAPISTYLGKDFAFENPNLSADQLTLRKLLTHQSGIENEALTWRTAYSGEDAHDHHLLLRLFQKSAFSTNKFSYSNHGHILSAIILEKITGKRWQDLLKEKIFKPMGMSKTSASFSDFEDDEPVVGHRIENRQTLVGETQKVDANMHAAGGIFSSVYDMAKWLMFNIREGFYNGKQLMGKKSFSEIHRPKVSFQHEFYTYKRYAYDLGWYHSLYEKDTLIQCFGSYNGGHRAHTSYMPSHKLGVVVMTNFFPEGIFLPDLLANYLYDLLLHKYSDEKFRKAIDDYLKYVAEMHQNRAARKIEEKELSTECIVTTSKFYNDDWGQILIERKVNDLYLKWGKDGLVKTRLLCLKNGQYKMPYLDLFGRNDYLQIDKDLKTEKILSVTIKKGRDLVIFK